MGDILVESFRKKCGRENAKSLGYSDVIPLLDGTYGSAIVERAGGGFIASLKGESTHSELHIIPHGGTTLPAALLEQLSHRDQVDLVDLVLVNCDTGTTEITRRLLSELISGESSICVAYFGISRLLLDANRNEPSAQVPRNPYIGSSSLYHDYLTANTESLRDNLLKPWLTAVRTRFAATTSGVIFHHHSMDEYGQSDLSYDSKPYARRPPAQLFSKRWGATDQQLQRLAPSPVLEIARDALASAIVSRKGALPVLIDDPLSLPEIPFPGCAVKDGEPNYWNIIYEIRKDQARGAKSIERWVTAITKMRRVVVELAGERSAC